MFLIGLILFGIPSAFIASSKGFKSLRWLIALGLIGLIVVSCKASAKERGISPEEADARAKSGDSTGATLAWIDVGLSVLFLLIVLSVSR